MIPNMQVVYAYLGECSCLHEAIPNFSAFSEKIQSYFLPFRQSYGCGGKTAKKLTDIDCGSCPGQVRGKKKERNDMKSNNQINVPQAKAAMEQFKMQAAQEVGVNLQNGYNGHLTSREAGSVGGQMVKKMIEAYEQGMQ